MLTLAHVLSHKCISVLVPINWTVIRNATIHYNFARKENLIMD
jgi:hypothetical protein